MFLVCFPPIDIGLSSVLPEVPSSRCNTPRDMARTTAQSMQCTGGTNGTALQTYEHIVPFLMCRSATKSAHGQKANVMMR